MIFDESTANSLSFALKKSALGHGGKGSIFGSIRTYHNDR